MVLRNREPVPEIRRLVRHEFNCSPRPGIEQALVWVSRERRPACFRNEVPTRVSLTPEHPQVAALIPTKGSIELSEVGNTNFAHGVAFGCGDQPMSELAQNGAA
jgi:hypothetical protein